MSMVHTFSDARGLGSFSIGAGSWTMLECTHYPAEPLEAYWTLKLSMIGDGFPELGEQTAYVDLEGEVMTVKVVVVSYEPREGSLIFDVGLQVWEDDVR